jgi:hypothetical protein
VEAYFDTDCGGDEVSEETGAIGVSPQILIAEPDGEVRQAGPRDRYRSARTEAQSQI